MHMRIEFGYRAPLAPIRAGLRARGQYLLPALFAAGYRPEAHYMRGPGPKWREKHGLEGITSDLVQQTLATYERWDLWPGLVAGGRWLELGAP
jgi:hypothetical protein